jgi:hypothetical protein
MHEMLKIDAGRLAVKREPLSARSRRPPGGKAEHASDTAVASSGLLTGVSARIARRWRLIAYTLHGSRWQRPRCDIEARDHERT